ncbi:MAG TPA: hypothetical protein VD978_05700 [Azospirillum sp.]|nr:hypothetical protein [Azospirillum sp.]
MARRPPARAPKRKKKSPWAFLLLMLPAALVVLPTSIVFGLGMIPTMVAYAVDRDPDKSAPITVGGLNLCGCLPYAIDLWKHGHTISAALKVFADPVAWLVMYGAAAVGWAFYYGVPPAVANAELLRSERRVETLRQRKVALVQEWGPEVAGETFDDGVEARSAEN